MNNQIHNVVLCLRSGGDFSYSDVELLAHHLHQQWDLAKGKLKIYCLFNEIDAEVELINVTLIPAFNKSWPGWWTKMNMFDPRMEKYRPFLYMDLDTAVVGNLDGILPPTGHENEFIALGGFFKPDTTNGLQSGVMWFPANNEKISKVWNAWIKDPNGIIKGVHHRGGDQGFLRMVLGKSDIWWQKITNKICSFKIRISGDRAMLTEGVPDYISIVCFHGQPRIPKAGLTIPWVHEYIKRHTITSFVKPKVTVIIPYKVDRGWLQDAINSVPQGVQLLVSQGDSVSWSPMFNKALEKAEGDYIKYLHDDDMLTPNCIEDSVRAIEEQGVDFIHGNSINIHIDEGNKEHLYIPSVKNVTLATLLHKNVIHSGTTMYRREIFEKLGGFDESLQNSEEYEFNLRCLANGFKCGYCNSNLVYYRRHSKQKSVSMRKDLRITGFDIAKRYAPIETLRHTAKV